MPVHKHDAQRGMAAAQLQAEACKAKAEAQIAALQAQVCCSPGTSISNSTIAELHASKRAVNKYARRSPHT